MKNGLHKSVALSHDIDKLTTSVQTYVATHDMSLFNKVFQYILYRQIDMLADIL